VIDGERRRCVWSVVTRCGRCGASAERPVSAKAQRKTKPTKKTVVLGRSIVQLSRGQTKTVIVALNGAGRRLLAAHHSLKIKLAIIASGRTVSTSTLSFKSKRKRKRKHKH
jgi:hypothetical protein